MSATESAGELMRDLQGIREKYDIEAPGIEVGEKELETAAAQGENERALEREIAFVQRQGKKLGLTDAQIAAITAGILCGAKPTAPKE